MARRYWLMKSEPCVYSIDDLERDGVSDWRGVRNYEARNFMKAMAAGDRAFFYHSNAEPPGVAGIAEVCRTAYPDPTQFDPKSEYFEPRATKDSPVWFHVDVKFVERLPRLVAVDELRAVPELEGMLLFKRGRLSVQPVTPGQWDRIVRLASGPASRRKP